MEYPRCDLAAGFSPCLVSEAEVNTLVDSNINHVLLGVGKTFISARVRGGQRVITRDCEGEFIGPKKESHRAIPVNSSVAPGASPRLGKLAPADLRLPQVAGAIFFPREPLAHPICSTGCFSVSMRLLICRCCDVLGNARTPSWTRARSGRGLRRPRSGSGCPDRSGRRQCRQPRPITGYRCASSE